jgi:hypothetical protein
LRSAKSSTSFPPSWWPFESEFLQLGLSSSKLRIVPLNPSRDEDSSWFAGVVGADPWVPCNVGACGQSPSSCSMQINRFLKRLTISQFELWFQQVKYKYICI